MRVLISSHTTTDVAGRWRARLLSTASCSLRMRSTAKNSFLSCDCKGGYVSALLCMSDNMYRSDKGIWYVGTTAGPLASLGRIFDEEEQRVLIYNVVADHFLAHS